MECQLDALAEDALLLRFGERIDAALNARVQAVATRLRARLPRVEIVAAYASLLLRYDPLAWRDAAADAWHAGVDGVAVPTRLRMEIDAALADPHAADPTNRLLIVPVLYDEVHGPDLAGVAAHARLRVDEVITRHTAPEYKVAMIGFAPGFPYLLGLDPALAMPRRASPRRAVPAGSVAIGGMQTGVYPAALPGGWQLIGRTPLALFDPAREPAASLVAGDRVRFYAIDRDRFAELAGTRDREPLPFDAGADSKSSAPMVSCRLASSSFPSRREPGAFASWEQTPQRHGIPACAGMTRHHKQALGRHAGLPPC